MQDLEIIFSRFGKVTSCDIIRDYKTGDSLCYAFIGFDTDKAAEMAFFKMENCLIDDRRIHVDFSQSMHHLWRQFRVSLSLSSWQKCSMPQSVLSLKTLVPRINASQQFSYSDISGLSSSSQLRILRTLSILLKSSIQNPRFAGRSNLVCMRDIQKRNPWKRGWASNAAILLHILVQLNIV